MPGFLLLRPKGRGSSIAGKTLGNQGLMTIRERISRQDIAKMVGASREMVSRVMKDLQMGGYIEVRGSNIVLRDTITLPE